MFDVRTNPGGLLSELTTLLDYLLPGVDIFVSVDKSGEETVVTSNNVCLDMDMCVLVNADSYSAAEFFAAALQEYGWATIVGEHTSAYDAVIAMFTEDAGTVFVATDNILAGVVSRKDLLKTAMGNNDLRALPVRMVMTPVSKVIYVQADEKALAAAQRMIEYEIDCLPVVHVLDTDEEDKKDLQIVGRISKTNITRLFVECGLGRRT